MFKLLSDPIQKIKIKSLNLPILNMPKYAFLRCLSKGVFHRQYVLKLKDYSFTASISHPYNSHRNAISHGHTVIAQQ